MDETVDNVLIDIIQNQLLGLDVNVSETFENHGFDSLDLANVVMTTEDEFGIELRDSDIRIDMTVSEYIDMVKRYLNSEQEATKEVE